ncbi:protein SGT1 homolog isoform X3 [Anolis sagrei]|uniref:protein SGT1 homolog isoform X3 n=1 Tax=Anolis sagrei TaxID=38937 RepID=UPI0035229A2A
MIDAGRRALCRGGSAPHRMLTPPPPSARGLLLTYKGRAGTAFSNVTGRARQRKETKSSRSRSFLGGAMMAEAAGMGVSWLTECDVEKDPAGAVQKLTAAIEQKPDDAEYYCQRAYAYILLQNYHDAITDAKRTLSLDPNNAKAFLRQGIGEYHTKNYISALKSLNEGQKLDGADTDFTIWIKRCEEAINTGSHSEVSQPTKLKYDWYQTESHVIVTVMIKNVKKDEVNIHFLERELNALVKLSSEEECSLNLHLLHPIIPEQSSFKVLSTKIEIKMKKPEAIRWEKLEGHEASPKVKQFTPESMLLYPSSSHYTRNWDKLVVELKEEEKSEKLEGDAALNKLFQQIYSDGTDEVKRAMNKSFMESGGTVLSTNWSDVGKRKVEVNPPDDMEWKKY